MGIELFLHNKSIDEFIILNIKSNYYIGSMNSGQKVSVIRLVIKIVEHSMIGHLSAPFAYDKSVIQIPQNLPSLFQRQL